MADATLSGSAGASLGAPDNSKPLIVSTSTPAVKDYNNISSAVNALTAGAQAQANNAPSLGGHTGAQAGSNQPSLGGQIGAQVGSGASLGGNAGAQAGGTVALVNQYGETIQIPNDQVQTALNSGYKYPGAGAGGGGGSSWGDNSGGGGSTQQYQSANQSQGNQQPSPTDYSQNTPDQGGQSDFSGSQNQQTDQGNQPPDFGQTPSFQDYLNQFQSQNQQAPINTQPDLSGVNAIQNQMNANQQQYQDQMSKISDTIDKTYNDFKSATDQIRNGTFPLTPDQQMQVKGMQDAADRLRQQQLQANQNYQAGIQEAGIASGRNRYAPEIEMGNFANAVNVGIQKISELDSKAAMNLATLKQSMQDKNYSMVKDQYDTLQGILKQKSDTISQMYTQTINYEKDLRDQNYKLAQDAVTNQIQSQQLDMQSKKQTFDEAMASAQFDQSQKKMMQDAWQTQQDNNIKQVGLQLQKAQLGLQQQEFNLKAQDQPFQDQLQQEELALKQGELGVSQGELGVKQQQLQADMMANSPTALQDAMGQLYGVKTLTTSGIQYFDPSQYSDAKQKAAAENLARQAGIPILSDPKDQQAVETVNTALQNLQSVEDNFRKIAATSPGGALLNRIEANTTSRVADTQYYQDYNTYKNNRDQLFQMIGALAASHPRVNEQELQAALKSLPTTQDTLQDGLNKLQATRQYLNNALNSIVPNRVYSTLDDYVKNNPTSYNTIGQMKKDHPDWNSTDILQILQSNGSGGGFNQPLSMGVNGSLSGSIGAKLGALSQKYESSGNPGAVGYDNTGGYSYGKYQLAHDSAKTFIDNSQFKPLFQGLQFNSPQWINKWKQVAQQYPQQFANAQDDYVQQKWYAPLANKATQSGLNLANYSPVLKNVIFSTAVQHGSGTDVIDKALAKVGSNASEADLIKAIYNERWSGGRRFANSTPTVRQSVYNRFFGKNGELNTALNLLSKNTYA